jgi:hypothetical protein
MREPYPFQSLRKGCFAQFTLQTLPVESLRVLPELLDLLASEPLLETQKVDKAHSPCALARREKRVFLVFVFLETDSAHGNDLLALVACGDGDVSFLGG